MTLDIENIRLKLKEIEESSPSSPLVYYSPEAGHAKFYRELCDAYRGASPQTRALVSREVAAYNGIVNNLLGFMNGLIGEYRSSGDTGLLMTALTAGSIRGDGPDFRDFYLVLVELFMAFKEAGMDATKEFNAIGGGIPRDFHTYAVMKSRLSQDTK